MSSAEYRILVVEDEESLANLLRMNLEAEGYQVIHAADGPSALEKFRSQAFDLAILDVMIPELDGFSVCQTIRLEGNNTPIMFLSAKGSGKDRIEGLKIGGDDYMTKPFDLEELLLRAGKLIVRKVPHRQALSDLDSYTFGPNSIDFKSFSIIDKDGQSHELSRKEIMLLKLLIQRSGEVVSREEILEKVWGYDVFPSTRTIDNFLLAFRKYFESDPKQPVYFQSVRGVGYKFSPQK